MSEEKKDKKAKKKQVKPKKGRTRGDPLVQLSE